MAIPISKKPLGLLERAMRKRASYVGPRRKRLVGMIDLEEYKPWLDQQEPKGDANLPYLGTLGPSGNADGQVEGFIKGRGKARKKKNDPMEPKPLRSLMTGQPNTSREDK
jgi:hypothetical protein